MKKERDAYPQHQKFQGYFFSFCSLNESSFQDFLSERLKSEKRNETKRTKSTGK